MKQVTINQCDFCTNTSFNKGYLKTHEKKCFHNPSTQSCATCLWFSQINFYGSTTRCLVGEQYEGINSIKSLLHTRCPKWITAKIIDDIDIFANERGLLDSLLAGDLKVLNIIDSIKVNGESYYNGRPGLETAEKNIRQEPPV